MKRRREEMNEKELHYPPWNTLTAELLEHCMSYCNASELFAAFRCSSVFRHAAQKTISRAETLHLSFLLHNRRLNRNQEECVSRLLESATTALKRLELVGLRHVQGAWLEPLLRQCPNLVSLHLGECASLDPELVRVALAVNYRSDANKLVELNLRGCRRIDGITISTIVALSRGLTSFQIDGCSQSIDDDCLISVMASSPTIRILDVAGLGRTLNGDHALYRFPSLEYLNMESCEQMSLHLVRALATILYDYLGTNDHESHDRIRLLANHSGDTNELWRLLTARSPAVRGLRERAHFQTEWKNLIIINLSHVGLNDNGGLPSGGLGAIAVFSGGKLREVNVTGCESVDNRDIEILAKTCGNSLTTLEARACPLLGDPSLHALGDCAKLANLDMSACFRISDQGIACLTPQDERGCPNLRSLKIASIANLTDEAVLAVGGLAQNTDGEIYRRGQGFKRLLLLSVRDCSGISSMALRTMMSECKLLIDLDSRGVRDSVPRSLTPASLRFLNGRRLARRSQSGCPSPCCTIVHNSQRLTASQGVTLQPMYACMDCKFRPSTNHGICSVCVTVCHKGHHTYLACFTRFYCDCAFDISGNACKALSSEEQDATSDGE